MSNNLNDIVDVQIKIAAPATSMGGFHAILIVGPEPATKVLDDYKPIGVYTTLEGVKAAGWKEGEAVYDAAAVAFSQEMQPNKIYVAANVKASSAAESLTDTLDRAAANNQWFMICPCGIAEEKYDEIAKWAEAHEKMACFSVTTTTSHFTAKNYLKSLEVYTSDKGADKYINVAFAAAALIYEPGSETWAFKTLRAVAPSELSATQMQALQENNISYFTTYGGKNITQGGKTNSGEWIDTVRFMLWLKAFMQERIYNIFVTTPKVPYTDAGIGLVETQIRYALERGQKMGGIAPTEYDEEGNAVPAYTVSVPRARDLTESERASRVLHHCTFTARLAGAIHCVSVRGTLTY